MVEDKTRRRFVKSGIVSATAIGALGAAGSASATLTTDDLEDGEFTVDATLVDSDIRSATITFKRGILTGFRRLEGSQHDIDGDWGEDEVDYTIYMNPGETVTWEYSNTKALDVRSDRGIQVMID